jgi:N-acetylglucosamine malate deacetylase 1
VAIDFAAQNGVDGEPAGVSSTCPMNKVIDAMTYNVWTFVLLPALFVSSSAVLADGDAVLLKVVVFGGHPDDPESGCGGLIGTLTAAGHKVHVGYATCFRGDRKINGQPEADVRQHEAAEACRILGARPHFFPYAHEKLVADQATLDAVSDWLKEVQPDVVITHWPLDMHPNHHVASSLIWQCYQRQGGWNLYFFEVMTGSQTLAFHPDLYLDLAPVFEKKKACLDAHTSQNPASIWDSHEKMHLARGQECGVERAEAYLLLEPKPGVKLLPVAWRRPAESNKARSSVP